MQPWIILGIIAAVIVVTVIAERLGWIDLSNKSRSGGAPGGVMGAGDEVFNPTRHEAQIELDRQTVLPAPAPLAGDGDKNVFRGLVEINLDDTRD